MDIAKFEEAKENLDYQSHLYDILWSLQNSKGNILQIVDKGDEGVINHVIISEEESIIDKLRILVRDEIQRLKEDFDALSCNRGYIMFKYYQLSHNISLEEPTSKQISYAKDMFIVLDIELPIEYTKKAYTEFIKEHKEQYEDRIMYLEFLYDFYTG